MGQWTDYVRAKLMIEGYKPEPWDYSDNDCPKRGPALSHAHSTQCVLPADICDHCDIKMVVRQTIQPPIPEVHKVDPPLDIVERLGLGKHPDDVLLEQREVTGNGPTGSSDGVGRGSIVKGGVLHRKLDLLRAKHRLRSLS